MAITDQATSYNNLVLSHKRLEQCVAHFNDAKILSHKKNDSNNALSISTMLKVYCTIITRKQQNKSVSCVVKTIIKVKVASRLCLVTRWLVAR